MRKITTTRENARRFLIDSFGLNGWQTVPTAADAIRRLEFVQEDSINICGRIHDLILWPRVAGYTPGHLAQTLYGTTTAQAFEYWFPNLCALPLDDYPHFVGKMRARQNPPGRWHGLTPDEEPVAERFLAALDEKGPLRTRAHGTDDGHTVSGWGSRATVVSHVAEKLWGHGRLAIARRENFERFFDRKERVYPMVAHYRQSETPLPDAGETTRHLARKRLRAKRLFGMKKEEFSHLGKDELAEVKIEGVSRTWYCLAEDADRLESPPPAPADSEEAFLLAPLDPLVYDRNRNRDIFGFDYTWEVYVPQEKRKWGYYVLPILWNGTLVGRVDPKIDRKTRTLHLLSLTLEPGVPAELVAAPIADRLRTYAAFLGAERIAPADTIIPELRNRLAGESGK